MRFPQSLVIAEYFNYDRFGEIVLALPLDGETRPFTGTAIDEPGAPQCPHRSPTACAASPSTMRRARRTRPTLRHPNGEPVLADQPLPRRRHRAERGGVLGYDFSLYRIFPTGPADYTAVNPRPARPNRSAAPSAWPR